MNLERIYGNKLNQGISNHLVGGYIFNDNLLPIYGVSTKMIMPLDMLGFPVEFPMKFQQDHQLYG